MKKNRSDSITGIAVIGTLALLLIPLPPLLLDLLLSLSLVLAVITLLLTFYVEDVLEFSAFPSLLLFLALFRLGLNLSSTRMILSKGEGGEIIRTFGSFVTEGNQVVGLALFLLLMLVNFTVITKGAGRIAEVTARFVLEALPGKQMAIEGEVQSHLLSRREAAEQRTRLSKEADFYGAMDGASKFLRGEAIASLLILSINLVGGLVVGTFLHKRPLAEVFPLYLSLTIGDGLITQLPALLVSIGAGILVTRNAALEQIGVALPKQIAANPKVLLFTAFFIGGLGLIPGMPAAVLLPMAFALALYARVIWKSQARKKESASLSEERGFLPPLELALGKDLISLKDSYLSKINLLSEELGFRLPMPHVREYPVADHFALLLKGSHLLSGTHENVVLLSSTLRGVAHELLSRREVLRLLESARSYDAALVEELVPKKLQIGQLVKILQHLLKEELAIGDFLSILEGIADQLLGEQPLRSPESIAEGVRGVLSRAISDRYAGRERCIHAICFDAKVEQMVQASVQKNAKGEPLLVMRPATTAKLEEAMRQLLEKGSERTVLLTDAAMRLSLRRLMERSFPHLPVLAYGELSADIKIENIGKITSEVLL